MSDFITQASNPQLVLTDINSIAGAVFIVLSSPSYRALLASHEDAHDPAIFSKAVKDIKWCQVMNLELRALQSYETQEVTFLPLGKLAKRCKLIYRVKLKSNGSIDKYKASSVALARRQNYGVDY